MPKTAIKPQTPIAHIAAGDPVQHDDEAKMMAERVAALSEAVDWDLPIVKGKPLGGQALQDWLLKKEDQAAQSTVERGIGYALLKRELGHGQFEAFLKDRGVSPRSARESMKAAKLLMALSPTNAQRAALLPHRKIQALAAAPAKVVDDLFESGALDDVDGMNRDQLREIVRLRKDVETQEERLRQAGENLQAQAEENRRLRQLPEASRRALALREAVLAETEALRVNAHRIDALLAATAGLPDDIDQADLEQIAQPLMFALQSIHAYAGTLFARGFDVFDDFPRDLMVLPPRLSDAELQMCRERWAVAEEDAAMRETMTQMDTELKHRPRKAGKA